ncbi:LacI family DNA-binding transcriptional regulator [Actinomadura algeriensis]|uniref:DNA-binding LacI/PurR family transcriptional regulator n=1 Tax=Actinomadura algeriensis TaxID=1679523 RepID=A0ABR9K219_9ACTN|nr:LacI family DNA-binding transcriptional regulator [Actinomadura algeriensis]MBE1536877.1 DNA-binding LacI/PurR family transcriptional regulator [Actinomadura algeriensis]
MARQPTGEPPSTPRARPATSIDVARLAGVSRATVSHVLNGQIERFSEDTVERVRGAAAELGYVRSAAGRALVMGRSDFIIVVVPYATFIRLQDVIEVISADIEELGFTMVVHFDVARGRGTASNRLQHMVETMRPAGVVDLGGLSLADREAITESGCPVLPRRLPSAVNRWIGTLQVRHLHSRGHTEIAYAFLADARDDPYGRGRASAVAAFCEAEGLAPPSRVHVPIEPEGARRVLRELVQARGWPVGIACYNDKVALALVFAAKGLGLAVPADVAVVGVEGADIGQVVSPRLTTVASDVADSVRPFRAALASAYGGRSAADDAAPPLDDAFFLLLGETT